MISSRLHLFILIALLFALAACGGDANTPEPAATSTPAGPALQNFGDDAAGQPTAQPESQPPETLGGLEGDAAAIAELLRTGGYTVEAGGPIQQPFFSVPGQVLRVDGEDVQLFVYPDAAAAEAEAAQIAPDGSSVGTTMISWVATPHFYSQERIIVLYVGDNPSIMTALEGVFGPAIAGGGTAAGQAPAGDTIGSIGDAFATGDYEALQAYMGDPFIIGYWQSEGQSLTPAEAIEQLRLNLLPDPTAVIFEFERSRFPDLGGVDPAAIFGPEAGIVDLVYSQGWGQSGQDEAILALAQSADGQIYWHGMIYGRFGGPSPESAPPEAQAALEAALTNNDYEAMQALMADPFTIGYWQSEGQLLSPAEATEQLRLNLLPDPELVSFTHDSAFFPDLGDFDLASAFGPDVNIVGLVYSQEWGQDGNGEAIMAISQEIGGRQFWHGLIYAPAGFERFETYVNPDAGYAIDYPAGWLLIGEPALGSTSYTIIVQSFEPGVGGEPVPAEEAKLDFTTCSEPSCSSLDALRARLEQPGSEVEILEEDFITLPSGLEAIRMQISAFGGESSLLLTVIDGKGLQVNGFGDLTAFDPVVQTLRPAA